MPCTADNLAGVVVDFTGELCVGIGELDVLFTALKLCIKICESTIYAAQSSDTARNGTAVLAVTVGAVCLLFEGHGDLGVVAVDLGTCGLDVGSLDVSVAACGNPIGLSGVLIKSTVNYGLNKF